jgi:hypothetical protein
VPAMNGSDHGGRGDRWRATQSSCASGLLTQLGQCLVLPHRPTGTFCIGPRLVYKRERKRKLACTSLAPFEFPQFFLSLFLYHSFWGGTDMPMSQSELTRVREVKNVAALASIWEDAEGLIRKVTLLEGELAEAR